MIDETEVFYASHPNYMFMFPQFLHMVNTSFILVQNTVYEIMGTRYLKKKTSLKASVCRKKE